MKNVNRQFKFCLAAIALISYANSSCMKKPDHSVDYGPEVSSKELNAAARKLGSPSIDTTAMKGNYSNFQIIRKIEQGTDTILGQFSQEITDSKKHYGQSLDIPDGFTMTWVDSVQENLADGSTKPVERQEFPNIQIGKGNDATALPQNIKTLFLDKLSETSPIKFSLKSITNHSMFSNVEVPLAVVTMATATKPKVTFHNLSVREGMTPVPDSVRAKPGCAGLINCENLRFVEVAFDKVVWDQGDKGTKFHIIITASPDVPPRISIEEDSSGNKSLYIDQNLSVCTSAWVDVQGRTVKVDECNKISDFQFGTCDALDKKNKDNPHCYGRP